MKEMKEPREREFCTVREAAEQLDVSVPTVWRWVKSGKLPALRIGGRTIRIRRSEVDAITRASVRDPAAKPGTGLVQMGDPTMPFEDLLRAMERQRAAILRRHGGKPLSDSTPLIREAREAWAERRRS